MADNSTSKSGKNSVTGKPFTAFEQAFLNARKAGDKTFSFRGKEYTTKLKSEHLLVDPPTPKPPQGDGKQGSDTRNQSPPGPAGGPVTNPPLRADQPTPDEIVQEQAAQGGGDQPPVSAGGALGLQGPGNPAAAPGPPPGAASAPPGPDLAGAVPGGPGAYNAAVAPPGGAPTAQGGPHPQFDAELAAFQQRQALAMQGQVASPPMGPGPQPAIGGAQAPGQGQAAGGPIGGPGTAAGYVPPAPGQGQSATMQLPPGPQPIGGDPNAAPSPDAGQGGAIDFQGLARYFYQLGVQAASGGGARSALRPGRGGADNGTLGGSR